MKKIYTFFGSRTLALSLGLGLSAITAFGQTSICGNTVENFNNTGGGTAGFSGNFSFAGTTGAGYLQKSSVLANGQYTITTPTFQTTANFVGYGFVLGGTERIARVEAAIIYTSSLNNEMTSVFLAQFVPTYDPTTPPTADVCNAIATSNLPGFPASGRYRIQIILTPNTGFGQVTSTVTFDDYKTNGNPSTSPLPVNFMGFEAKKMSAGAQLTWKVAGEENVNHYEVERSTDGRSFASIGNVSITKKDTYTYTDVSAASDIYYRIKNVDNDGKFKYSNIARIANGKSSIVITAFPQPVISRLTVQHPAVTATALITINTADGRIVNSIKPSVGSMQTFIDMSKLQKGLYVVRFNDGEGAMETMKVIKQ